MKAKKRKGAKVWIGENKALANRIWWFWNEEEEVIRKGRLKMKGEKKGKSGGKEKGGVRGDEGERRWERERLKKRGKG